MTLQILRWLSIAVFDRLMPSRRNQYRGNYSCWEEAAKACKEGYAQRSILEKVKAATQEVICGSAVFERDSVTFHHEEYNWPLLSVLWREGKTQGKPFAVLDFGGALGSAYFQNRKLLQGIEGLHWCVVEQPHYVACGRELFETECLRFYPTISECLEREHVAVALFSSVLAYLPDPWKVLSDVTRASVETIMIDQTQVLDRGTTDRIVVQSVPSYIYRAQYPMRLFTQASIDRVLNPAYVREAMFEGFDAPSVLLSPWQVARYKGYIWKKMKAK
jgi:putative methyltransferase (TIGR04325 family)